MSPGGVVDQAPAHRPAHTDDGRKVVVHLPDPRRDRLRRWEGLVRAHESALSAPLGADRVAASTRGLGELAAGN